MSAIDPADYAELKQQVATLRQEMATLLRFIHLASDETDETRITGLTLKAEMVTSKAFILTDDKGHHRGRLDAWDDEAALSLYDEDEQPRVVLTASKADTKVELRDPEGKSSALLQIDDAGHGNVAVFSAGGVPRVVIKGRAEGGSVATLAPDGMPRGILLATEEKNEVLFLDADQKVAARLGAYEHGGVLRLDGVEGEGIATMAVSPAGGTIMLQNSAGQPGVSALAATSGNLVKVHNLLPADSADEKTGLTLLGLQEICSISLRGKTGKDLVDIMATASGGSVMVKSAANASEVDLDATAANPALRVTREAGGSAVIVATEDSGLISVRDREQKNSAYLGSGEKGGHLIVSEGDKMCVSLGLDGSGRPAFTLHNEDNSVALQLLRYKEGGAASIYSTDGTRQGAFIGSAEGGKLALFGDLGIERAFLQSKADGASLRLRWGGTNGLDAVASEAGGYIIAYDETGKAHATLPEELHDELHDDEPGEE